MKKCKLLLVLATLTFLTKVWFLDNGLECNPKVFKDVELNEVLMKIKSYISLHKFKLALKFALGGMEIFQNETIFKYV